VKTKRWALLAATDAPEQVDQPGRGPSQDPGTGFFAGKLDREETSALEAGGGPELPRCRLAQAGVAAWLAAGFGHELKTRHRGPAGPGPVNSPVASGAP